MADADIFVHPSHADGWGMVITEALAAGLPIIASPETGAASYYAPLNPRTIMLVDSTDTDKIADAMSKMAERILWEHEMVPHTPMSWEDSGHELIRALASMQGLEPSFADPT
jgi:glycosyltransferase involved in cell wall biosynthesis